MISADSTLAPFYPQQTVSDRPPFRGSLHNGVPRALQATPDASND